MSQQINLINLSFRKVFDWLTATPLVIATGLLLVVIAGASAWASMRAEKQEQAAGRQTKTLKDAQERMVAMAKLVAESKPSAELANELANTLAMLKNREEIINVLEGGSIGSTTGFAEFLRGFARQTPTGLWLTGFTVGANGSDMEIRGRMVNPSTLPEYIRRLKTEPVFQGRGFASLTIQRPAEGKEKKLLDTLLDASGKPVAPTIPLNKDLPPSFVDFVLLPGAQEPVARVAAIVPVPKSSASTATSTSAPAKPAEPQKQGFVDPVLTPKTENIGRAAMDELKKGNEEQSRVQAEAMKKLTELMPPEKKP